MTGENGENDRSDYDNNNNNNNDDDNDDDDVI